MQRQPEEDLRTIEQKIKDARDLLTITEENYLRFQNLNRAEQFTLSELTKAKAEITKDIEILGDRKKVLKGDIESLETEKTKLTLENNETKNTVENLHQAISKREEGVKTREQELTKGEEDLKTRITDVTGRENKVADREREIDKKHEKIKNLIREID